MKIIIYQSNIIEIGGIETFTYNLSKTLSDYYEVLLLYKKCHPNQLYRLMQEVECEEYNPKKEYECDICILASSWDGYPDTVNAKEYIQMIHANYKEANKTFNYKYKPFSKTTKHLAVSKIARDVFKDMYGYECELMYNLLGEVKETKPILKLVSATRLSAEKGYDRMLKLIEELKKRKIKFRWIIFTGLENYKIKPIECEEVTFMKPRYDLEDYIKEADYIVQLSDTEGFSYTINESLQLGTPTLTTAFDSIYESVEDGKSGYILPFKLFETGTKEEWDKYLDKIVNKIPKDFKYESKCKTDDWLKLLGNADSKYKAIKKERKDKMKKIRALQNYTDSLLKKDIVKGDEYIVDNERAEEIVKVIFKDKPLAEIIEDIKEELKESNKEVKPKITTKKKATKKK
jgi:glycosyltransferase involved in cell wall biosynthesis